MDEGADGGWEYGGSQQKGYNQTKHNEKYKKHVWWMDDSELRFYSNWKSILSNTSSTAQGGGGSFKKRKTLGQIGCCESRMSKQKH